MPVAHIGFKLKPAGLLRRQPGAGHAAAAQHCHHDA